MKLALTTAAALFAASSAVAAPIALSNAGLETNSGGQFTSLDDWSPSGAWALHSGFANAGYTASMGNNFGYYSAGTEYVLQETGVTIAAGTNYSVNLGAVTGGGNDTGTVAYVLAYVNAGADLSDGIDIGEFTVFASATQVVGDPWVAGTGVTSTATGAAIGQELLVGLGSGAEGGDNDIWFDNFTADASPVPEPGSLALIGLGGLALLRRRR
jgi:hypothetical protein